ncbi:MAG: bacillithiol biosynthesis deacetylase BshB1 [Sphingobacteriales bacterium]|nr:bacillithiol biosynthesis deacetylase BshB1 [Sphingobacteriales bacterium]
MKLDLLAIGVHPDDVELGCSGTIINEVKRGKRVGVVDLTQGELGTRGNIDTRYQEAAAAGIIMGISVRENLRMRDGFFVNDEAHQLQLIKIIRKYKPDVVIGNAITDRHPDHGRACKLIEDACFYAGLAKVETKDDDGKAQEKWRPAYVLHYIQDRYIEPHLIIDISDVFEQRMKAIEAYSTQFKSIGDEEGPQTYISSPAFYESVVARARMLGKRIGVKYAEGFTSDKKIGISNLDALIKIET